MVESTLKSVDGNVVQARMRERIDEAVAEFVSPSATVSFTHLTTVVDTTVQNTFSLGLSTTTSIVQLIVATTTLQDRVNQLTQLVNQITYVLKANHLSS